MSGDGGVGAGPCQSKFTMPYRLSWKGWVQIGTICVPLDETVAVP